MTFSVKISSNHGESNVVLWGNIIKQDWNRNYYRATAETLNFSVSVTGSMIHGWEAHGTTNHPCMAAPCKISHCAFREQIVLQDDLKAAKTTVTQRTIRNELHFVQNTL